jgi:Plasmid pRiA4b ORF-3-like protein
MSQPSTPPSIYRLHIVLQGISPLIWRRLLVRSDTTLAHLHDIIQIVFHWSDEHLHSFYLHGRAYGSNGADTRHVPLSEFRFHRGERFRYVYDFIANWACDIRVEAILSLDPKWCYPVCIGGKRAAPPEDCRGAWAYMERLDQHRSHPPIEAMLVAAEAVQALLETDPHASVREAVRDLDELREAVNCLEAYQQFQPEHFRRRHINAQLHARAGDRGDKP